MRWFKAVSLGLLLSGPAHAGNEPIMIGGSSNAPIVIPFEDKGLHGLFVPVMIDGHGPYRFKLSLASQSMILTSLSDRLHLPEEKVAGLTTGYTSDASKQVTAKLEVGGADVPAYRIYTRPDSFAQSDIRAVPDYSGTLGIELLQDHAVAIDFDRKTLTLSDSFEPPSGAQIVDTVDAGTTGPEGTVVQRPGLVFDIDGVSAKLALDLDAGGMLAIDERSPAAKALQGRAAKTVKLVEEDYEKDVALVRTAKAQAGALSLSDVITMVTLTPRKTRRWDPRTAIDLDGGIGLSVLRRFNITIDRYGTRVALSPRAPGADPCAAMPPYLSTGYGSASWSDGTERIDMIVPGSPAERAGLKTGDLVLLTDGALPGTTTTCTPSAPVRLRLKSQGQTRDVTLTPEPLLP